MSVWQRRALVGVATGLACSVVALACDREKAATPGEVMVEVTTNLAVPQDLSSIQILVSSNGVTQLDQTNAVGPGNLALPATFGVVVGPTADPSAPAKIDVIGYRNDANGKALPQIVNEAIVTIPESGIVLLRMPLDYLCLGQFIANPAAKDGGVGADGGSTSVAPYISSCATGESCQAGTCQPETMPSSALPVFAPTEVYGGGGGPDSGACFDVVQCFGGTSQVVPVTLIDGGCQLTTTLANLNVAIETTNGLGVCAPGGGCFAVLDEVTSGALGWSSVSNGNIALPPVVCGEKIVVSHTCASKTADVPVCSVADSGAVTLTSGSGSQSGSTTSTQSGSTTSESGSESGSTSGGSSTEDSSSGTSSMSGAGSSSESGQSSSSRSTSSSGSSGSSGTGSTGSSSSPSSTSSSTSSLSSTITTTGTTAGPPPP